MELRNYASLIQRWLWLVIAGAVVAAGATYFISTRQVPQYRASATYLVDSSGVSSNEYGTSLYEQSLAQEYAARMVVRPVLAGVIERLGLETQYPDPSGLAGSISVSAVQQTKILRVTVQHRNPETAAAIANAVGEVFSELDRAREDARFGAIIANWNGQLAELEVEIAALEQQVAALEANPTAPNELQLSQVQRQLNETQIRYTDAFNAREAIRTEQERNRIIVTNIEAAQPNYAPVSPKTTSNTTLAAVVGATLAVAIIFLVDYLDDTVKSPSEVFEEVGLSTLAAIAYIRGNSAPERLIASRSPRAPVSEAYRMLRTNLRFAAIDEGLHTILVTSSSPGEGKSTTSANLGVVLAQTGQRVLLVDGDLRRPSLHKILELPNGQGLTTALLDTKTDIASHVQSTSTSGLSVLPSGPLPPNPAELLNSQRMITVLRELRDQWDVVIMDTPPVLSVTDAAVLAPHFDGVALVVEIGETRLEGLRHATERLENAKAHILGVVLNRSTARRSNYYRYYYDYQYYTREYDSASSNRKGRSRLLGRLTGLFS